MGNYEYFRKNKTNGNLLIFYQTTTTYFRCKNGDIREGDRILEYLLSKVNFPANFSVVSNKNVSNAYHFQVIGAFK